MLPPPLLLLVPFMLPAWHRQLPVLRPLLLLLLLLLPMLLLLLLLLLPLLGSDTPGGRCCMPLKLLALLLLPTPWQVSCPANASAAGGVAAPLEACRVVKSALAVCTLLLLLLAPSELSSLVLLGVVLLLLLLPTLVM
jgi:hypothetical protein